MICSTVDAHHMSIAYCWSTVNDVSHNLNNCVLQSGVVMEVFRYSHSLFFRSFAIGEFGQL